MVSSNNVHQARLLYPNINVVTEDFDRDCYVVEPAKATSSKSFEILSTFRKTKGEWKPSRPPSRLVSLNSIEFAEDNLSDKFSGSKTTIGSTRPRRRSLDDSNVDLDIRPITVARSHALKISVKGNAASAAPPASLTLSLYLSDIPRPPTSVCGRAHSHRNRKEPKRDKVKEVQLPAVHPVHEDFGKLLEKGLLNCSFPGETETLVMQRNEGSLRHPETYARWLGNLRQVKREMDLRAAAATNSSASSFKHSSAGQFHAQLSMLSHDVLNAVQLNLDHLRSEIAGLCAGSGMRVVGGASAVDGFAAKYGQRKLELAMLRKHLFEEDWTIRDVPGLNCNAGATGFNVWINGLTVKRLSLRNDAHIKRAIVPFFNALKNGLGQVSRQLYVSFNSKVFRALLPVFDVQESILLSEAEWRIDSGKVEVEKQFLNEHQFFTSLFELADNWCENPDVSQMVTWLNKLRVTLFDNQGRLFPDKDITHDERFWFDGIDPLVPSFTHKLQALENRGTRNIMFDTIQMQLEQQANKNKRSTLTALNAATRPKAANLSVTDPRKRADDDDAPHRRPSSREAFNIDVGGKKLSLIETLTPGDDESLKSYLNDVRIPNVWAAELKALAAAYIEQASKEHGTASDAFSVTSAGTVENDGVRSKSPAQVYALPQDDNEEYFVDDQHLPFDDDGALHDHDEPRLLLAPFFFEDGEQVGDVRKLHRLHDLIYGRAPTPSDVAGMRFKLGPDGASVDQDAYMQEQFISRHHHTWLKTDRWAKVGRPNPTQWARFKAARAKERERIHIMHREMRHHGSSLLQFHYTDAKHMYHLKSFAERWEEKEEARRQASVFNFETVKRAMNSLGELGRKQDIAEQFSAITDVLDGTYKGTYHGAHPGRKSGGVLTGLEFEDSEDLDEDGSTCNVPHMVETRLWRMGMATPTLVTPNASFNPRRPSRPSTSMSSLELIDETRVVDEPVLGWSSGLPAPVKTPSAPIRWNRGPGVSTPQSLTSDNDRLASPFTQGSTWTRISTPSTLPPFSPALAPLIEDTSFKEGEPRVVRDEKNTRGGGGSQQRMFQQHASFIGSGAGRAQQQILPHHASNSLTGGGGGSGSDGTPWLQSPPEAHLKQPGTVDAAGPTSELSAYEPGLQSVYAPGRPSASPVSRMSTEPRGQQIKQQHVSHPLGEGAGDVSSFRRGAGDVAKGTLPQHASSISGEGDGGGGASSGIHQQTITKNDSFDGGGVQEPVLPQERERSSPMEERYRGMEHRSQLAAPSSNQWLSRFRVVSRDALRQRKSSAGSALDLIMKARQSPGHKDTFNTSQVPVVANPGSGSDEGFRLSNLKTDKDNELASWDPENKMAENEMAQYGMDGYIDESRTKYGYGNAGNSRGSRQQIQLPRTPSLDSFEEHQEQVYRELKAEVDGYGESSDDDVMLPALVLKDKGKKKIRGSTGGKVK